MACGVSWWFACFSPLHFDVAILAWPKHFAFRFAEKDRVATLVSLATLHSAIYIYIHFLRYLYPTSAKPTEWDVDTQLGFHAR